MNPRQISLVAWSTVALIAAMAHADIRASIRGVIKSVFTPVLLVPALLSLVWVSMCVFFLQRASLWTPILWWDTLAFALAGTTSLVWRMLESKDYSRQFYWKIVRRSLGASVLLGVMVSTYTFSLPIELVLVPWLVALGMLQAFMSSSAEYAGALKLVNFLIAVTGLSMVSQSVAGAMAGGKAFLSLVTVQSFLLLMLLTVAYLPFLLTVRIWFTYDSAFEPIRQGAAKPLRIRLYARLRVISRHWLALSRLDAFRSGRGNDLRWATTREAVDAIFDYAEGA